LTQHPITGKNDIAFIKKTIAECTNSVEVTAREKAWEESAVASSGGNRIRKYPMLRIIHALIYHVDIKRAFHTCHNILDGLCMGVKNRNIKESKASSVCQLMADKWDDPLLFFAHCHSTVWCPLRILPANAIDI